MEIERAELDKLFKFLGCRAPHKWGLTRMAGQLSRIHEYIKLEHVESEYTQLLADILMADEITIIR